MTQQIVPLEISDLDQFVNIMAAAYPGLSIVTADDRKRMADRLAFTFEDPAATIYGFYETNQLLAGMILYEFTMNVRGQLVRTGGLGSLAVDLLHRKRKLARDMVVHFLEHERKRGSAMALLYPFRPDFYRRMGFGYGTKMNQYQFRPAAIRASMSPRSVQYLTAADAPEVLACFNRYARKTHGMILGSQRRVEQMLGSPAQATVGYVDEQGVRGYLTFDFLKGQHFLQNDLQVKELIYENGEVLNHLLAFLKSLADQCERVLLNRQDEELHFLIDDPRNRTASLIPSVFHESNVQGVGLMYRILALGELFQLFEACDFGKESLSIKINLVDSLMSDSPSSVTCRFEAGRLHPENGSHHDVEIWLDVGDFSSLFMGVIGFRRLTDYGLARISDDRFVDQIDHLFATAAKPICMTAF